MRATIDTNIFVYMIDARDAAKQALAIELIQALRNKDCSIALQCVGEFYAAVTRRLRRAPWEAAQGARNLLGLFKTFAATQACVERALAEAMAGRFSYWDAHLLASAHEAQCELCFSEDMSDGAKLGGVEVVHPFNGGALSSRTREFLA